MRSVEVGAGPATKVARSIAGDDQARVIDWTIETVGGGATEEIGLSGGIRRVSGTMESRGHIAEWSAILKILKDTRVIVGETETVRDDPSGVLYWRREADAYASGLLDDLGDGLAAPRCWGIDEGDGRIEIWLEDLHDDPAPWTIDRYRLAAVHLGRFNGIYLDGRALPEYPWLSHGWTRDWLQESEPAIRMMRSHRRSRFLETWLSARTVERIEYLLERRSALEAALAKLPKTVCHHDAQRRNLVAGHAGEDRTYAVDWAAMGTGHVGYEIAVAVSVTLQLLEVGMDDARDLEEASLDGYLTGLRDAGVDVDEGALRFAVAARLALVMGLAGGAVWFDALQADPANEAMAGRIVGHPLTAVAEQWSALWTYLLDRGDDAFRMLDEGGSTAWSSP